MIVIYGQRSFCFPANTASEYVESNEFFVSDVVVPSQGSVRLAEDRCSGISQMRTVRKCTDFGLDLQPRVFPDFSWFSVTPNVNHVRLAQVIAADIPVAVSHRTNSRHGDSLHVVSFGSA